jgi:hypothetical protein
MPAHNANLRAEGLLAAWGFPNNYTLSKHLAEYMVSEALTAPVCVVLAVVAVLCSSKPGCAVQTHSAVAPSAVQAQHNSAHQTLDQLCTMPAALTDSLPCVCCCVPSCRWLSTSRSSTCLWPLCAPHSSHQWHETPTQVRHPDTP